MAEQSTGPPPALVLVEDSAFQQEVLSVLLVPLGYKVYPYKNAEDALSELSNIIRLEALLSDVELPGMSGIELGHCARDRYPNVLFLARSSKSRYRRPALEAGFKAFLEKPVQLRHLKAHLLHG